MVERLLYPGYVLIQAQLNPELEYIIRNDIPGMSGFLTEKKTTGAMTERVPVPIRDDEAQWILGNQDQNVDNPVETEVNSKSESLSRSPTDRSAVSAEQLTR